MTTADILGGAGLDDWFASAVGRMVRGNAADLDPYLVSVGDSVILNGTKTNCRCHFVARDGNDRPRVKALAKRLSEQAIDYCIPRSRVAAAFDRFTMTGSADHLARINAEALDLFTSLEKTGEGGEMLLFLLLERLLRAPQLLCKMALKTSSEMHFHGADGVHIKALPDGRLGVYWCESKLHASANSATDSCFDSIAPFLLDEGGGASDRDLLLVRDHVDTGDEELDRRIVQYFISDQPEALLREIRGASLIGFSLDDYPHPHEADGETVVEEVLEAVQGWFDRVGTRVGKHKLEAFEIDVFCLPMPSVEAFRTAFRKELGLT